MAHLPLEPLRATYRDRQIAMTDMHQMYDTKQLGVQEMFCLPVSII